MFKKLKLNRKIKQPTENIRKERKHLLTDKSSFSTIEEYKALRTNIMFSTTQTGCKIIGITSANASEGKSITCLNLAITFAQTKAKVLIIDCDLRKPKRARLLMIGSTPGISNVLVNLNTIEEVVKTVQVDNASFHAMPSGDIPPNPSELLGSEKIKEVLEQLAEDYDYIFIDTPPMNVVADASVLSKLLTGIILVVRAGRTERDAVQVALEQLNFVGANVLGFVLNGVSSRLPRKYKGYKSYYRYYYRHDADSDQEEA
jgi:capsular exopolysaccharide synthesis family protein